MTITSTTVVRNGMPFIGKCLERVEPYMDKMLITVSKKSSDGTIAVVEEFAKRFPDKVELDYEDVPHIGLVTDVVDDHMKRCKTDWLVRVDDDDLWPIDQLELCLKALEKDTGTECFAVNPYQLIDFEHWDWSWRKKYFSKFMRNLPGLQCIQPFPRDLPADRLGKPLYWRMNEKVKRLPYYFFHLSYLKTGSLRNEPWATPFRHKIGKSVKLTIPFLL